MVPEIIHQCIKRIARIPGIGQRHASRIVFFLLRARTHVTNPLIQDLERLCALSSCTSCLFPCEPHETNLCAICRDPQRDPHTIIIVEKETDLLTIEKAKIGQGTYYILGGLVNPVQPDPEHYLNLQPLLTRIAKDPRIKKEVIFALSPTAAGNLTATYIERKLRPYPVQCTRLGRGLPNGGDVEFTDEETMSAAFMNRK
ncbi:MAG: toprim domain-containing protein [Patescibacteria group bacterium]|nr:toprim domain-containing protein [Patescibacteria group bacterium]MDE2438585.1 toprim domain-containing protein [Patescibacteria group bacterium]